MSETAPVIPTPEWKLVKIGAGSFGTVMVLLGRPVAFKVVQNVQLTAQLHNEFTALQFLYKLCNPDPPSFFLIPRPLAYYDPNKPSEFESLAASPPSTRRALRPVFSLNDVEMLKFESAAYAMDLLTPLPLSVAKAVRQFYPPLFIENKEAPDPSICRLYFGKEIAVPSSKDRPIKFFNSSNFPLDLGRYETIAKGSTGFPSAADIAFGMGEMVGRIYWRAGYDARDIEFVLGGLGGLDFSNVGFHCIDFNQAC
jgi:hypothetical protein